MPGGKRVHGPVGTEDFRLRLTGPLADASARAPGPQAGLSFGLSPLKLELDPDLQKAALRHILSREDLFPMWDFLLEHGRPVLSLPLKLQKQFPAFEIAG